MENKEFNKNTQSSKTKSNVSSGVSSGASKVIHSDANEPMRGSQTGNYAGSSSEPGSIEVGSTKSSSSASDTSRYAGASTKREGVSTSSGSGKEGNLQESIMKQINDLGDLLERAGEKIEKAGFSKIGDAIYRLGDRLEHLKRGEKISSSRSGSNRPGSKADDSVEVDSAMGNRNKSHPPAGSERSQAY